MSGRDVSAQDGCHWAVLHHPSNFTRHSGLSPLVERLGLRPFCYDLAWQKLQQKSWTAGHLLRRMGNAYYGSEWNALIPFIDEWRMGRVFPKNRRFIVHFMWGEFAGPRRGQWIRRRGGRVVGTFHCSARRQASVLSARRCFEEYDWITLMSESQKPFFVERGFPKERISVILHGVDTGYFCPGERLAHKQKEASLRAVMVGSTERDHAFLVRVLNRLPPGLVSVEVYTHPEYHTYYQGAPGASLKEYQSDDGLRRAYQRADLLLMPMLDCTANNAVLESMACGTPVMINQVGGVPDYVDPDVNMIMSGKSENDWAERLTDLAANTQRLDSLREGVRRWVARFDWNRVASQYNELYRKVLDEG